jgi:hypothetical protein
MHREPIAMKRSEYQLSLMNEKTKSNGHRNRVEPIEMVETMKSFEDGSAKLTWLTMRG